MTTSTENTGPILGDIKIYAGFYAPAGWAFCQGQIMAIAGNEALFDIIGSTYGGNGRTSFALPDLRGRIIVGSGEGTGLTPRRLGDKGGVTEVTLTTEQLPSHNHRFVVSTQQATQPNVQGNLLASPQDIYPPGYSGDKDEDTGAIYLPDDVANTMMVPLIDDTIDNGGHGGAHYNLQPFTVVNYIICTSGDYPSYPK